MTARETTHACPPEGEALTPCCERTPFELPRSDRMTLDDSLVTCGRGRETTLGALTAADLGKRVRVGTRFGAPAVGPLFHVEHRPDGTRVVLGTDYQLDVTDEPETPVTVYDEDADDDR